MADLVRLVSDSGADLLSFDGDAVRNFNPVLRELDLGYPAVRDVTEAIPGMDGEVDSTLYMGSRAITAEVLLGMSAEVVPLADKIRALMQPGRRMWLHVRMDGWSDERRIRVRGASLALPTGPLPWSAQLGWVAPDPTFQELTQQSVTLSPQGSAVGGTTFPREFPFAFDPGLVPGAAVVDVGGTVSVPPVVDIYGPCTDPLVRVVNTGAQMILRGDIAAGDFVRINTFDRTILRNNDPNYSVYGTLDFAASTWLTLPVGQDVQVVFSPQSSSVGCQAVLRWANRWL